MSAALAGRGAPEAWAVSAVLAGQVEPEVSAGLAGQAAWAVPGVPARSDRVAHLVI